VLVDESGRQRLELAASASSHRVGGASIHLGPRRLARDACQPASRSTALGPVLWVAIIVIIIITGLMMMSMIMIPLFEVSPPARFPARLDAPRLCVSLANSSRAARPQAIEPMVLGYDRRKLNAPVRLPFAQVCPRLARTPALELT